MQCFTLILSASILAAPNPTSVKTAVTNGAKNIGEVVLAGTSMAAGAVAVGAGMTLGLG